jgi:hypothetical protein
VRASSRIFAAIGVFAVVAMLLLTFGYGGASDGIPLQAALILSCFALACFYLAVSLRPQGIRELDGLHLPSHDEPAGEIHLPGPSIFPALYGLVAPVLLVGLLFKYEIAIAGVVGLVVVTVGWARESVADYRREIAHAPHGADEFYSPGAIGAAHKVQAFARAHHGADAVVHHIGNGRAQIAIVGKDGKWGSVTAYDVDDARTAVRLAGVELHDSWTSSLGSGIKSDPEHWNRMAGEAAPRIHHGPRDGTTQVAARIFLPIGIFGLVAALGVFVGYGDDAKGAKLQAAMILTFFFLACTYLYVALRAAKGSPDDHVYADATGVTREPTVPDPPVDLETLHLPGPSIWPAAYSIAATMLLLGLVFQLTLALAGLVALVACTIGWGVESVKEYRATLPGAGHSTAVDHSASTH